MLRREQNDLLTQTGPGTPGGALFRSYWIPALLAQELPENECPPVRVKLLSERLLAFRDTQGRYGLIDEFCAHRGVSLWFGRNEENGLRCPYHGWKYEAHQADILSAGRARRHPVDLHGRTGPPAAAAGIRVRARPP
jgi:nitrite reductase/ring-hydroxylating ferredoxin subunit